MTRMKIIQLPVKLGNSIIPKSYAYGQKIFMFPFSIKFHSNSSGLVRQWTRTKYFSLPTVHLLTYNLHLNESDLLSNVY